MNKLTHIYIAFIFTLLVTPAYSNAQLGKLGKSKLTRSNAFESERTIHTRLVLSNSSQIDIYTPESLTSLSVKIEKEVKDLYSKFNESFSGIPKFTTAIHILDEKEFFELTDAPEWTNALYYDGKILIPVSNKTLEEKGAVLRTVKHEFSHSLINALTNGNCPGWLDEGLAQWTEGSEIKELKQVLKTWIGTNKLISFKLLQNGFTGLKTDTVAPAYAQSLYASKLLIKIAGKEKIEKYFRNLRNKTSNPFERSFGFEEEQFAKLLEDSLKQKFL